MRFSIIVILLIVYTSIFCQIEYETVGAMPAGHNIVDFFDFDGDEVEEIVVTDGANLMVYGTALQLQQTFDGDDLSQYFPTYSDTLISHWFPGYGTFFFNLGDTLCVAICYNIKEVTYDYGAESGGNSYFCIDFLRVSDMALLSNYQYIVGTFWVYEELNEYVTCGATGSNIVGDRIYISTNKRESWTGAQGDFWGMNTTTIVFEFNIGEIGSESLSTISVNSGQGPQMCINSENNYEIFTTDFSSGTFTVWDFGSALENNLRHLRILNGYSYTLQATTGVSGDYQIPTESIPVAGGLVPRGDYSTYNLNPIFYSAIRYNFLDTDELNLYKYDDSYQNIDSQTTESYNSIDKLCSVYTEAYGQQLILFAGEFDDQNSLHVYTFSDVVLREEIPLPGEIVEIWEPGDGYCYLISGYSGYNPHLNDLYRITAMQVDNDKETISVLIKNLTNYPNPFNPETTFSYNLVEPSAVSLKIYNVKGQLVRELVNENQQTGSFEILWNGTDSKGEAVG
ncbi:MAG: T9SS type A sorting domain-containing protein, partial [Candidatus Cloacimonetes bacterium]|nr:T9SS type A sorting domain-containing protein [Candidatus Cloacimonadota bacterium]